MKQRFSKRTRLVSALLTLAMVFTFLPFSAFAASTANPEIDFNSPDFALEFPDAEFRRFLRDCCDTNGDGKLDVDIQNMTIPTSYGIKSLKGIQRFEDLEKLDCHGIGLTTLNVGKNFNLKELDCSGNQLKEYLPILSSGLKKLNCSGNQLMELNVGNQTQLTELDCHNNKLTELNVEQNGSLTSLICNDNQLKSLDLSQNHSLSNLNCAKNRLACLNVTGISGTITADGNRRPIAVRTDGTFDLNTLPGFDVSKATYWNGGSVSGTILTVEDGKDEVDYHYDCGNGVNPTFIFETSLPINEDNFPDDNFRNYIKTYIAGGGNVLTVEKQRKVESIKVEGWNISDLKGIEAFPNLKELNCGNNSIQELDLRQNPKLETLKCNKNQLTQLELSKNPDIKYLYCSENQLGQLDVSHLELEYLYCSHNDLEQLNVKKSKWLKELDCSSNRLTALDVDVTHKPNLVRVECQNNKLTSLILGENQMLEKLNCANNQLPQLNLNNMSALKELNCANNQLTVLDVSSSQNLTKLWLKNNHLTSLNLDNNPNLNSTYTDVYHSDFNNVYTATLTPDRTFDLSTLPGNFDKSRVTGWVHGNAEGNTLTVDEGTNVVYYGYTCRSGMLDVSFKLDVAGTGGSTGGGSTGGGSTGGGTVSPVTPPSGGSTGVSGGSDGGAGIAVLAIGGAAVAGLVGYGVYNHVAAQKLRALLPPDVSLPENRAKTALLLWDTAGRPEPAEAPAFADVADPDTAKAAQWCVEQGLMKRRLNGRFGPDGTVPAYRILNAYRQLTGQ